MIAVFTGLVCSSHFAIILVPVARDSKIWSALGVPFERAVLYHAIAGHLALASMFMHAFLGLVRRMGLRRARVHPRRPEHPRGRGHTDGLDGRPVCAPDVDHLGQLRAPPLVQPVQAEPLALHWRLRVQRHARERDCCDSIFV